MKKIKIAPYGHHVPTRRVANVPSDVIGREWWLAHPGIDAVKLPMGRETPLYLQRPRPEIAVRTLTTVGAKPGFAARPAAKYSRKLARYAPFVPIVANDTLAGRMLEAQARHAAEQQKRQEADDRQRRNAGRNEAARRAARMGVRSQ